MLRLTQLIGFGAGGGYQAKGWDFDGVTDRLTKIGITGGVNSSIGLLSFWVRVDGIFGAQYAFHINGGGADIDCYIQNADNAAAQFYFNLTYAGSNISISSNSGIPQTGTGWHHVMLNYDVSAAAGGRTAQLYVDGTSSVNIPSDGGPGFSLDFSSGATVTIADRTSKLDGCLSEFYYAQGQSLGLGVSGNRDKFIAGGKPSDLGLSGENPTGASPQIYLFSPAALTAGHNAGTGGNFTINGAPTDASTSPSD